MHGRGCGPRGDPDRAGRTLACEIVHASGTIIARIFVMACPGTLNQLVCNVIVGAATRGERCQRYREPGRFLVAVKFNRREPATRHWAMLAPPKKNPPAAKYAGPAGHFIFALSTDATCGRDYAYNTSGPALNARRLFPFHTAAEPRGGRDATPT